MKTFSLKLPPNLSAKLNRLAKKRGQSKSEVVREAIRALVAARKKDRRFQQQLQSTLSDQQRVLRQLSGDER